MKNELKEYLAKVLKKKLVVSGMTVLVLFTGACGAEASGQDQTSDSLPKETDAGFVVYQRPNYDLIQFDNSRLIEVKVTSQSSKIEDSFTQAKAEIENTPGVDGTHDVDITSTAYLPTSNTLNAWPRRADMFTNVRADLK